MWFQGTPSQHPFPTFFFSVACSQLVDCFFNNKDNICCLLLRFQLNSACLGSIILTRVIINLIIINNAWISCPINFEKILDTKYWKNFNCAWWLNGDNVIMILSTYIDQNIGLCMVLERHQYDLYDYQRHTTKSLNAPQSRNCPLNTNLSCLLWKYDNNQSKKPFIQFEKHNKDSCDRISKRLWIKLWTCELKNLMFKLTYKTHDNPRDLFLGGGGVVRPSWAMPI